MPTSPRPAYGDSLAAAQRLAAAVDALIADAVGGDARRRPRRAGSTARVPYQQTEVYRFGNADRRRLGGQGERLAARRGPDRLCRRELRRRHRREPLRGAERHRQPDASRSSGGEIDATDDHAGAARGHAAGGRRDRGERRHRLSRHRVPALGPGPQRHRARRRQPALDRLRRGRRLHRRQLRPPRRPTSKAATDLLVSDLEWMVGQWAEGGDGAQGGDRRTPTPASSRSSPAWAASPTASRPASACSSA